MASRRTSSLSRNRRFEAVLEASQAGEPLSKQEIAELIGWSPDPVDGVQRTYVDQRKIVVAIGERTGGKLQDALI